MTSKLKSRPKQHTCVVCMGEACCRKGSATVLEEMQKRQEADGRIHIFTSQCVGQCGSAPAAIFDRQLATRLDRADALARLGDWVNDAA